MKLKPRTGAHHDAVISAGSFAAARVALVNESIAVVVDPVAHLGTGLIDLVAEKSASGARRGASSAHPKIPCVAWAAAARVAIVYRAVAVVVNPVAHLGTGLMDLVADDGAIVTR